MYSMAYNASENPIDIMIIDGALRSMHRIKRLLFTYAPPAVIRSYNPLYKGFPGKDYAWEQHDIVIMDEQIADHAGFKQLRESLHQNKPCTVMLTNDVDNTSSKYQTIPGIFEVLSRSDINERTITSFIERATTAANTIAPRSNQSRHDSVQHAAVDIPFSVMEARVGKATIEDYKIERLLGVGGMSAAYLARKANDPTPYVIKTLKASCATDDDTVERFVREYQIAKGIHHDNIVKIYDQKFTDEFAYIVMEYLPGASLKEVMRNPLRPKAAARFAMEVSDALATLHDAGIVHRDIKPSNFAFNGRRQPVLIDFGISKHINEDHGLTQMGQAVGTPYFMSPEQILGKPVDGRSDLYAFGVMLYKMITGRHPFNADSTLTLMYKHVNDTPPPLQEDVGEMGEIIIKLMRKDPSDRYNSAHELKEALAGYLSEIDLLL